MTTHRVRTPTVLQMEAVECGAAALGIILAYYQRYVPLEELRLTCGVSRDGSNAFNILRAAREYGLKADGLRRNSLEGLKNLKLPLIVFWNFNHFVVVEGFDERQVYINDPASGPRTVTVEEFDTSFTGVVLACEPGPDFRPGGERFNLIRSLRRRLAGAEFGLIYVILASLFLLIPGFVLPALLKIFVDEILIARQDLISPLLIGMAIMIVLRAGLTWLQQSALLRLETRLAFGASANFFHHVLRLPIEFFMQRYAGEISFRVQLNDRVATLLSAEVVTTFIEIVLMVFYGVLLLHYDVLLTIVGAVSIILNLLSMQLVARRRVDASNRLVQERSKLISTAMNGLRTIETLKANNAESDFFTKWAGLLAKVVTTGQQLGYTTQLLTAVSPFLIVMNMGIVLVVGGMRVIDGAMTPGMLVAFQSLILGFTQPVRQLVYMGSRLQEAEGDLARLDDVLRYPPEIETLETPSHDIDRLQGSLEARNLYFGYTRIGLPLIEDFNVQLEPGQWGALVGASGSGKSTVARLIAGIYLAWKGEILFDDMPRSAIPREKLVKSVALVDQTSSLFAGTLRDNLTLWDNTVSDEELMRAAKDACIHHLIMERGGYDLMLEEGGYNFSGGERQRLEIARALVTNPAVLILDEATSALDPVTESQLIENLRWRRCTCLIVAHRLSTIRHCDEIIVLEQGKVVQRGTHESLLEQDGVYARLINADETVRPVTYQSAAISHEDSTAVFETSALVLAMRALGFSIPNRASTGSESLAELAREVRIRARRVTLRGSWWLDDNGKLLAFHKQQPAALIPHTAGGYSLYQPVAGTRTSVDHKIASELETTAYQLYPAFPEHALNVADLFRFIWSSLRRDIQLLLFIGIAGGVLGLVVPLATQFIFDSIIPSADRSQLLVIGVIIAISGLATSIFQMARSIAALRIEGKFDGIVLTAVWDRLLNLPPSFFRRYSAGDLTERAMGVNRIKGIISDTMALTLLSSVFIMFNFLLLFSYDALLAAVVLGMLGFALTVILFVGVMQLRYLRQITAVQGEIAGVVLQLINGIIKLRSAGAELRAFSLWLNRFSDQRRLSIRSRTVQNALTTLIAVHPSVLMLIIFALVYAQRDFSTGAFAAFTVALSQTLYAALYLGATIVNAMLVVPFYERLKPILQTPPEVNADKIAPGKLTGMVEVQNVFFRYYPNMPLVLNDLSLQIRQGEFVALVSVSGAGKSTLLRLMLGFETPEQGEIYYDGQPLSRLDVQAVRRQIGVVLQHGQVVSGDIFRNIVGANHLSMDDAWNAVRLAGLEEDIRRMPMGMQTYVNEEGSTLSGGQKQRLLIARALATQPQILFFDEATSALDDETQAIVMNNLKQFQATRIVIAHRLNTVIEADRILVLEKGRIVESGSYEELMAAGGRFAALAQKQLK